MVFHEILKTRSKDSEDSSASKGANGSGAEGGATRENSPPDSPTTTTGRGIGRIAVHNLKRKSGNKKSDKNVAGNALPAPKYLFCIYSPIVYESEATRTDETENLIQSVWKSFTSEQSGRRTKRGGGEVISKSPSEVSSGTQTPNRLRKQKIRVRMASLISKMLDRLISENVIALERVLITTTQTQIFARILTSEKTVPTLIMRCERIGIGNVVGACWVTPIDLAVVPSVVSPANNAENTTELALLLDADVSNRGAGSTNNKSRGHHHHTPSEEMDLAELGKLGEKNVSFGQLSLSTLVEEERALNARNSLEASVDTAISIGGSEYSDIEDSYGDTGTVGEDDDMEDMEAGMRKRDVAKKLLEDVDEGRKRWISIASRMRIEQVLQEVRVGATFSFDYFCYVVIAAWIAAFGLATDSSTIVIASMLVSPLMGPCMGMTFGSMVREWGLVWMSFRNECVSLAICVLIGFCVGLMFISEKFSTTYNEWPSDEMVGRGELIGLIYGVLIALPSGMAVALAQLGKNSGGLTGVAISLSLLPPAVNAGLCWCVALLVHTGVKPAPQPTNPIQCPQADGYFWCPDLQECVRPWETNCTSWNMTTVPLIPLQDTENGDRSLLNWVEANPEDGTNYAVVGTFSFFLTLLNIACIFLGGCFMFWLKEVVPIQSKNTFWTHDVKAYRAAQANGHSASTTASEIEAIEKGIRASIMLNDRAGMTQSFQPQRTAGKAGSTKNMYASTGLVDDLRGDLRRAYASNALEDALFVGNIDVGNDIRSSKLRRRFRSSHHRNEVPLNHIRDEDHGPDLFSIDEEEENDDDLANERESLMRTVNRIPGGLSEAGSVLFSQSEEEEDPLVQASFRTRRRPSFARFRNVPSTQALRRDEHENVAMHLSMT